MMTKRSKAWIWAWLGTLLLLAGGAALIGAESGHGAGAAASAFPPPLESYQDAQLKGLWEVLKHRVEVHPFNLVATILFFCAVLHTFFTHKFRHIAHVLEDRHREKIKQLGRTAEAKGYIDAKDDVSVPARLFHFLGEVEAVFGIWVVPLLVWMALEVGMEPMMDYVNHRVSYHEPLFVVVIMTISATRPVLRLAENCLKLVARFGGYRPVAWWFSILTFGPLLGSFITEPAAMTISAMLLAKQFYRRKPSLPFAYATLGLLFVNVSVGGTLTHFAAPPVLMVAGPWGWDTPFMFKNFGELAIAGVVLSNLIYYLVFRKEFTRLQEIEEAQSGRIHWVERDEPVPAWVTIGHLLFMAAAVMNSHYPAMLIGSFLFFLAFFEVTEDYQGQFQLRSPILVGFFLAGLKIHGELQQWWIQPVLSRLSEVPLMFGAIFLTAFNDNAAITFLATLVPSLTDGMKHAVVSGAVIGGGLTVIANAPNPAGQSILQKYFPDGISPLGLFLGAFFPTAIMTLCFLMLHHL